MLSLIPMYFEQASRILTRHDAQIVEDYTQTMSYCFDFKGRTLLRDLNKISSYWLDIKAD